MCRIRSGWGRRLEDTDAASHIGVGEIFEGSVYSFLSHRRHWQEVILYRNMFS
jgi:hypothetical protein